MLVNFCTAEFGSYTGLGSHNKNKNGGGSKAYALKCIFHSLKGLIEAMVLPVVVETHAVILSDELLDFFD